MTIYKRYKRDKIKSKCSRRGLLELEHYVRLYEKTVPEIVEYLILVKVYWTDIMAESEWFVMVEDTVPQAVMQKAQNTFNLYSNGLEIIE
jgi:hypothetical protein